MSGRGSGKRAVPQEDESREKLRPNKRVTRSSGQNADSAEQASSSHAGPNALNAAGQTPPAASEQQAAPAPVAVDNGNDDEQRSLANRIEDLLLHIETALEHCEKLSTKDPSAASSFNDFIVCLKATKTLLKQDLGGKITFVGRNGTGKSWIINLLVLLSRETKGLYKRRRPNDEEELSKEAKEYCKDVLKSKILTVKFMPDDYVEEGENSAFELIIDQLKCLVEGVPLIPKEMPQGLLPSRERGKSTTPCVAELAYGKIWQVVGAYKDSQTVKEDAWEWAKLQQADQYDPEGAESNSKDQEKLETRYKRTVCKEQQSKEEILKLQGPEDVKLHPDVAEVAGTTIISVGQGKEYDADFQFVRDEIAQMLVGEAVQMNSDEGEQDEVDEEGCDELIRKSDRQVTVLNSIRVFCPITILKGGNMICDSPGSDDSDPIKKKFPHKHQIAFLHYPENSSDAVVDAETIATKGNFKVRDAQRILELNQSNKTWPLSKENKAVNKHTEAKFLTIIAAVCKLSKEDAKKLCVRNVSFLTAYPTLFSSLYFNGSFQEKHDPKKCNGRTIDDILDFTGGYQLLGLVEHIRHVTLDNITEDLLAKFKQVQEKDIQDIGCNLVITKELKMIAKKVQSRAGLRAASKSKNNSADRSVMSNAFFGSLEAEMGTKVLIKYYDGMDFEDEQYDKNTLSRAHRALCKSVTKFCASDGFKSKFKRCSDQAKLEWDATGLDLLRKAPKTALAPNSLGSDSALDLRALIFRELPSSIDFKPFLNALRTDLDEVVKQVLAVTKQFLMEKFREAADPLEDDLDEDMLSKALDVFEQCSLQGAIEERVGRFCTFGRTFHITEHQLEACVLPNAQKSVMKSVLQELQKAQKKEKNKKKAQSNQFILRELSDRIPDVPNEVCEQLQEVMINMVSNKLELLRKSFDSIKKETCSIRHLALSFASCFLNRSTGKNGKVNQSVVHIFRKDLGVTMEALQKAADLAKSFGHQENSEERMAMLGRKIGADMKSNHLLYLLEKEHGDDALGKYKVKKLGKSPEQSLWSMDPRMTTLLALPKHPVSEEDFNKHLFEVVKKELSPVVDDYLNLFRAMDEQLFGTPPKVERVVQLFKLACRQILKGDGSSQARIDGFKQVHGTGPDDFVQQMLKKEIWADERCLFYLAVPFRVNVCLWVSGEPKGIMIRHNKSIHPSNRCVHIALTRKDEQGRKHFMSVVDVEQPPAVDAADAEQPSLSAVGAAPAEPVAPRRSLRRTPQPEPHPFTHEDLRWDKALESLKPKDDLRLRIMIDTNVFLQDRWEDFLRMVRLVREFKKHVKLFVPYVVWREELDRMKKDFRARSDKKERALKARGACRWLDKMKKDEDEVVELQGPEIDGIYREVYRNYESRDDNRQLYFARDCNKKRQGAFTLMTGDTLMGIEAMVEGTQYWTFEEFMKEVEFYRNEYTDKIEGGALLVESLTTGKHRKSNKRPRPGQG